MSHPIRRDEIVHLIGKTVDMTGGFASSVGIIIEDVGEKYIFYRFPGITHDNLLQIALDQVQRISWEDSVRKFVGKAYAGEKAERGTP